MSDRLRYQFLAAVLSTFFLALPVAAAPTSGQTEAAVQKVRQAAGIRLAKGAQVDPGIDGVAGPGDLIHYTLTVTNIGGVTLTNVTVTDPVAAPLSCPSGNPVPALAPEEMATCTGTYTLTQADIDVCAKENTATATGTPPVGGPIGVEVTLTVLTEPFCIPPGIDCWQTECGATKFSFCDDVGTTIPAGFFGLGSEPFQGEVLLRGRGLLDTEMQRMERLVLREPDTPASVPIELLSLDLVSCEPINVIINGQGVDWDVEVELSDVSAGQGAINVTRTHANGGVFDATFPVHPRFTFIRVDDPTQVQVLDTGEQGLEPSEFATVGTAPWVSQLAGLSPLICGTAFAPGVEEDPVTLEQCCRKVGHSSGTPGHVHETGPPDCSACPMGACCNGSDGSCTVVQTVDNCPDEYKGDGTDCRDSDGDSLPDVLETNSCCVSGDSCNVGSDPNKADTDGDGIDDGDEIAMGTNPCVADPLFADGFESGDTSAWSFVRP